MRRWVYWHRFWVPMQVTFGWNGFAVYYWRRVIGVTVGRWFIGAIQADQHQPLAVETRVVPVEESK